ncbi:MAG: class I SAM-dependent methyltransferase [Endomicrobiales bacterium]|nr:class I SAM-dependent methyltransferase [Endomicrobiales bacterium]
MRNKIRKSEYTARLYNDLSWIWPIISPPEEYTEEIRFFANAIKKHSRRPVKTLLHLGCGGGHNDFTFKKYFKVTGVDISPRMLQLARRLNPGCRYVRGDIRKIRLEDKFDAVTTGDAIAYMLNEKDLLSAFRTAFFHLKPGGAYIAVPELKKEGFRQNRTEIVTHRDKKATITYIERLYDPDPRDTVIDVNFIFIIQKGGKTRVETDKHAAGLMSVKTWRRLLRKAGFKVKEGRFGHSSFPKGYYLPMFICLKPVF